MGFNPFFCCQVKYFRFPSDSFQKDLCANQFQLFQANLNFSQPYVLIISGWEMLKIKDVRAGDCIVLCRVQCKRNLVLSNICDCDRASEVIDNTILQRAIYENICVKLDSCSIAWPSEMIFIKYLNISNNIFIFDFHVYPGVLVPSL